MSATARRNPLKKARKVISPSVSHDEAVKKMCRDPEFAAHYLQAAMEEADAPQVFLTALRRVAEARGMAKVARAAGIPRESLYRALSSTGNPTWETFFAVARALGIQIQFAKPQAMSKQRRRAA